MIDAAHPTDLQLTAFALGDAEDAERDGVARHLEGCDRCRATVGAIEEEQGRILSDLPGAAVSPDALQRTFEQIDAAEPPDGAASEAEDRPGGSPASV